MIIIINKQWKLHFLLIFFRMVQSCAVNGCKNRSNDSKCLTMSWHRVPSTQVALEALRRVLPLPSTIQPYHRICGDCMKKVKVRKQPFDRSKTQQSQVSYHNSRRRMKLSLISVTAAASTGIDWLRNDVAVD